MITVTMKSVACTGMLVGAIVGVASVRAQIEVGTWVRQADSAMPGTVTMTVDRVGGRWAGGPHVH